MSVPEERLWTSLLIPIAAALAALVLRGAYADPSRSGASEALRAGAIATVAVVLSQGVLAGLNSGLVLPGRMLLIAGGLTFANVWLWQRLVLQRRRSLRKTVAAAASAVSAEQLRLILIDFQRRVRRRNRREYAAAVIVLGAFGHSLWVATGPRPLAGVGPALIMAAALYVVYQLSVRGTPRTIPLELSMEETVRFYGAELRQEHNPLRTVWRWYLLPFVPGLLTATLGLLYVDGVGSRVLVMMVISVATFWSIATLNKQGAQKIQHEITALASFKKERDSC